MSPSRLAVTVFADDHKGGCGEKKGALTGAFQVEVALGKF
jgi:hypothetical protein